MTTILEHVEELLPHATPAPKLRMRDISAWNGVPDIESLPAPIIAVKATEGTGYTSPVFQRDWINVKAAGKARMAYHFLHPSISGIAQARYFLDTVKNAGLEDGDCLCVDHESTDGLNAAEVAAAAVAFKNAVQAEAKCSLVVYTFIDFAKAGNCAGLGNNPLWIADPSDPLGSPVVPEPWGLWTFQQSGVTKGISDDICNFTSIETFYKFAVLPTPPPLTPSQRMVELSDGTKTTTSLVDIANFVAGFTMTSGTATLKVTEDGMVKPVPNIDPAQAAAVLENTLPPV
jgi:lysozyme